MNQIVFGACCASTVFFCVGPSAILALEPPRDLALETRAIFSARCAGCHGPALPKPRGRFGYVLDLARVAANPEIVVPSFPDESELWQLVRRGEMPPDDAPTGPLSAEEKDTIRAWIAAGAPANPQATAASSPAPALQRGVLRWLGPLHLVVVHFPIALIICAAAGEFWRAVQGSRVPMPWVRFCVSFGAASAVAAATLGWIHAANGHGTSAAWTLGLHRWIGTTAAAWAVVTALISEWDERRGVRTPWFRAWLWLGALLVAVEGHFGGMLVHGDDFLGGG